MFLVVQRVADNCVNIVEDQGLLFCFNCDKMVGYRLEAGRDILVLMNIRPIFYVPQRVNVNGAQSVIIASSHEADEVAEVAEELGLKRRHDGYDSDEPATKRIKCADFAREVIEISDDDSDDGLSDVSSEEADEFIDINGFCLTPHLAGMRNSEFPENDEFSGLRLPEYDDISEVDDRDLLSTHDIDRFIDECFDPIDNYSNDLVDILGQDIISRHGFDNGDYSIMRDFDESVFDQFE